MAEQGQGFSFACIDDIPTLDTALLTQADTWLADSVTSSHVILDQALFTNWNPMLGSKVKGIGDALVTGQGTVLLQTESAGNTYVITLHDAICMPTAPYNLISILRLTAARGAAHFSNDKVHLLNNSGLTFVEGMRMAAHLYNMKAQVVMPEQTHTATMSAKCMWDQWH